MTMPHCWARLIRVRSLKFGLAASAIGVVAFVCLAAGDPMAELKAGASALDAKQYAAAVMTLTPLVKRIPKLADYAAFLLASAQFESQNYAAVPKTLDAVWKQAPGSPLVQRALLL